MTPSLSGIEILYITSLIVSVSTCFIVTIVSRRTDSPGTSELSILYAAAGLWSLATLISLFPSMSPTGRVFINQVELSSVVIFSVSFALFVYQHIGLDELTPDGFEYAFAILPPLTLVFIWTNSYHNLVWTGFTYVQMEPIVIVSWTFDSWFYVHLIHNVLLLFGGSLLLLQYVVTSDMYTGQAIAISGAVLIPLTVYILDFLGYIPTIYPVTQSIFWISALLAAYAIRKAHLFSNAPCARVIGENQIVSQMSDGVAISNARQNIISANEELSQLLDTPTTEIIGKTPTEILPVTTLNDATEVTVSDGSLTRVLHITRSPLFTNEDAQIGNLLVFRDITDEKRREQQLEVTNRILRHNLRNKLTIALGNLETLKEGLSDDDPLKTIANNSFTACERLDTLATKSQTINDIFKDATFRSLDVETLVQTATEKARSQYPQAEITVTLNHSADVIGISGMENAIFELIENAVIHSGRETPEVHITTQTNAECTDICVTDNGPGIPPIEREVIEEDATETPLFHSSGVGLWLAHWTVSTADGTLSFEVDETGTTATLNLKSDS